VIDLVNILTVKPGFGGQVRPARPDAPPQKPGLCGPGEPGARARPGRDPRDCS